MEHALERDLRLSRLVGGGVQELESAVLGIGQVGGARSSEGGAEVTLEDLMERKAHGVIIRLAMLASPPAERLLDGRERVVIGLAAVKRKTEREVSGEV
jgi:hypothetical protein